jgi:hypothetical protein
MEEIMVFVDIALAKPRERRLSQEAKERKEITTEIG